ncbi:MAG TPA: HAMP domain-containing sensor histidine kinase [Streptosporangiaceae bacterium]
MPSRYQDGDLSARLARQGGAGPAGLRLALAFVSVALAAVALLAGLTAYYDSADVSHLATRQQTQLTQAVSLAAAAAWDQTDSWSGADLSPVLQLADQIGADVQVRNTAGRPVASSLGFAAQSAQSEMTSPVSIRGAQVGDVTLRFKDSGVAGTHTRLRGHLLRAIIGAAGAAALLALLVGLVVSRRISSPVTRLIDVVRAMGRGDRTARAGKVKGPAELRDLAAAFDQMADSLALQERLRRHLVADVAHELRTPIAVLQVGHEAMLDGVAEPTPEQLGSLRDEVMRLAMIVDDLRDLASAEAATLQIEPRPCDLADLAGTAAGRLDAPFGAAGVTLRRELASAPVLGDPVRLQAVITNLLTNALKFTPADGTVTVTVGQHDGKAVLRVSDTGAGIAADDLPHVFERFFRGRQTAGVTGSGIGLTVVAELVHAHHGQVDLSSKPGRGTTVTVALPLLPGTRPGPVAAAWQPAGAGPGTRSDR